MDFKHVLENNRQAHIIVLVVEIPARTRKRNPLTLKNDF